VEGSDPIRVRWVGSELNTYNGVILKFSDGGGNWFNLVGTELPPTSLLGDWFILKLEKE
jgi:hypothetical protein